MLVSCVKPRKVYVVSKKRDGFFTRNWMEVPCRKCYLCRKLRARTWAFRMRCEMLKSNAVFLTLTYDDLHVPISDSGYNTLCSKHLTDFIKRLRWRIDKDYGYKISYYACGEYGDLGVRPHYHLALFGVSYEEMLPVATPFDKRFYSSLCHSLWTFGFNEVSVLTPGRCLYIANYIEKAGNLNYPDGVVRPFTRMSKGIGLDWFIQNKSMFLNNPNQKDVEGHSIVLPQSFIKKLKDGLSDSELLAYQAKLDAMALRNFNSLLTKGECASDTVIVNNRISDIRATAESDLAFSVGLKSRK